MTHEKMQHEIEQEMHAGIIPAHEQETTIVRPPYPKSVQEAREQALTRANGSCEASLDGCTGHAPVTHQIESRYGFSDYRVPGTIQTADNYLVLCGNCHNWIHANVEESVRLGYLHQSWLDGINDSLPWD
jgi:hypothetical protein